VTYRDELLQLIKKYEKDIEEAQDKIRACRLLLSDNSAAPKVAQPRKRKASPDTSVAELIVEFLADNGGKATKREIVEHVQKERDVPTPTINGAIGRLAKEGLLVNAKYGHWHLARPRAAKPEPAATVMQ
jgi:hypothetical protein